MKGFLCIAVATCVQGFVPPHLSAVQSPSKIVMGTTSEANKEKKVSIVKGVKEMVDASSMVFAMPVDGLTVNEVNNLRASLPEAVTMRAVKNTLMRRALEDTEFQVVEPLLKKSNYWFFVPEGDMRESVEALKKFHKDGKKDETNPMLGGAFGGDFMDAKGIEEISKLPTKKELIETIAVRIKAVPLKLAKSIKQVPTKTARAINLATVDKLKED